MEKSEKTMALAAKKLAIQMVIETATKDTANPFFKSKYADLCEVVNTIKKAMSDSGKHLLIEQFPHTAYAEPGKAPTVTVTTRITDVESGEYESFPLSALPKEDTPQAIGSTITYLRRYSLMPVFGVVPEDDDGNSASGKKDAAAQHQGQQPAQTQQQPSQGNQKATPPAAPAQQTQSQRRPPTRSRRGASDQQGTVQAGAVTDQNRLVGEPELDTLRKVIVSNAIIYEKLLDIMERDYRKRDPKILSVKEINELIDAIKKSPETINQGIGF